VNQTLTSTNEKTNEWLTMNATSVHRTYIPFHDVSGSNWTRKMSWKFHLILRVPFDPLTAPAFCESGHQGEAKIRGSSVGYKHLPQCRINH